MPKKAHFPNVNTVKRRDGSVYFYHRKAGVRLPDDYGSPAFAKAWADAEARSAGPVRRPHDPDTYVGLVSAFKASDEWSRLKDRTRSDYQRIFDWMSRQGADDKPAALLSQGRCEKLLDKCVKNHGWRTGLYVLQVNRRLYGWVLERAARRKIWGDINPWQDLKPPQRPRNAPISNRAWTPAELAHVLETAPLGLRRAYVMGASGFDGSTMRERRWSEYDNGGFSISREKTGVASYVMVPRPLRPYLELGDRPSEFIITTTDNKPFISANSLQTQSSKFLIDLARTGEVGTGLTLHGLRHTIGKALADSGAGLHAIQAALQHKSARMALFYSGEADKKRALLASSDALETWYGLPNASDADCKTSDGTGGKVSKDKG